MAFEFLARAIRHGQDGFTQNDQETDMGRYFPGMIPRKKKWDRSTTLTTQATPGLDKKIAGLGISKGIARVYLRVSTDEQDLQRQERIQEDARQAGYYIAGVYREKASGARADRPELLRMIDDLQYGEVVIAEKIDRLSRLPLAEAEQLVEAIRAKGARLAIPGLVDLSEVAAGTDGVTRIVLESMQQLLLKLALQMAHDDYETRRERQRQGVELARAAGKYQGRRADEAMHARIRALRAGGHSIAETARLAGCSSSQVKRVMALQREARGPGAA